MSITGRRGSNESGWSWARPPSGPQRPPPGPPLLPIAGAGVILLLVALALLGLWLADRDDSSPAGATGTPTAIAAVTATPTLTPSPSPVSAPASPTPASREPLFRLAAWDGEGWQFQPRPEGATYREGEAVPFLLRIDAARPGTAYPLTIRYDCQAFAFLTAYDRDHGGEPALASAGPESAAADATLSIPDDPGTGADDDEAGTLSLWGGTFADISGPLPPSPCTGQKSLAVELVAAADTLHLMWATEIAPGAGQRDAPLRLAAQAAGAAEIVVEIDPASVRAGQP